MIEAFKYLLSLKISWICHCVYFFSCFVNAGSDGTESPQSSDSNDSQEVPVKSEVNGYEGMKSGNEGDKNIVEESFSLSINESGDGASNVGALGDAALITMGTELKENPPSEIRSESMKVEKHHQLKLPKQ